MNNTTQQKSGEAMSFPLDFSLFSMAVTTSWIRGWTAWSL